MVLGPFAEPKVARRTGAKPRTALKNVPSRAEPNKRPIQLTLLNVIEPNICYNRLMTYNWQQPDWPDFQYDLTTVEDALLAFAEKTGRASGLLSGIPQETQTEAIIEMMVVEALKTSEIEGEYLSRQDVLSSIRKNLGLGQPGEQVRDQRAQGAAALMTDVRTRYAGPLTKATLCSWHRMIMQGSRGITVGKWRNHAEPMQVVSGPIGKPRIHFEAPPSTRVSKEISRFITWFNDTGPQGKKDIKKPLIRSAIAHVYFESIHPFEDGNGRIGRALSEKALSQGLGRPALLSLSRAIEANRAHYYEALQKAQQSNHITPWISWFVNIALAAQQQAEEQIEFTLRKTRLFDRLQDQLNSRQMQVVRRMLEEGPSGFTGGINAKKYMAIAHTSKATATRDLQDLVAQGALTLVGGGRSTRYEINLGQ
ncbi:MAG TPA: Fic family protein [Nitrospirales bacterium]|nr:Fic family protein [Nitrospirales bacterium]